MAELVRMPEVAAGSTAAVLSDWPVPEGASFHAGDAIMTVETDKAEVDVEAHTDGTLIKALVPSGTEVEVGSPVAVIAAPGEDVGDIAGLLAELGVTEPAKARAPVRPEVPGTERTTETATAGRILSSPLARRLARDAGIDIATITGTGPGGRIVRDDVNAAIAARTTQPTTAPPAPAPAQPVAPRSTAAPRPAASEAGTAYEVIPHSRIRRTIAGRLAQSKQNAPHFYLKGQVRVGELLALRQRINADGRAKISVNDLLIKAIAMAHVTVPEMNVVWTADAVHRFHTVDVSVAIATDTGLVTPVLRSVETLSLSAVSAQVRTFTDQARNGTLRQGDLEGGSITISNLGMYAVEEFTAIINPPQAAILAVGTATRIPVVTQDGSLEAADVMTLTLSVDHRPVDGVLAARWFAALRESIEKPLRLIV
ncbi:pyruvate dehydrogenase E2 component (dihydrolipoamide acetyltransferase) [Thermocatellispora tengchongensis]|uniref:Dihydrolipoamide acetyltransferase component of pyruvate dehydrogenase complex n=1 Tax=Thermocatellispora tengchongensis TaxID=1073253 RepID=A0A840PHX7_9ACTN|nr:2-oxo acid dehydrogenase subunit E2 [Thermocatellispora tengchongensis]MBB5136727.1 pyruvate dehydrogenase E2 component (dihydrolipoamide acetyltransferase) [Thermocatellispora tengchongensis]